MFSVYSVCFSVVLIDFVLVDAHRIAHLLGKSKSFPLYEGHPISSDNGLIYPNPCIKSK